MSSYEIKVSKTGHKVPIVDNIYLHSIYDPIKEASNFIEKIEENLITKNKILFLGLGFGYHINEAHTILDNHHCGDYSIVVIDPNKEVAKDCLSLKLLNENNITLYIDQEVHDLYSNKKLINFLLNKPFLISHPSSFNLYRDYFKEFLTHKCPQDIESIKKVLHKKELIDFLDRPEINPKKSLNFYIENVLHQKNIIKNKNDYLLLALHHLTKYSNPYHRQGNN